MKKGPVILALAGLALLLGLLLAPITPASEERAVAEEHDHNHDDHQHDAAHSNGVDSRVDTILQKMQSGELAPMQGVMQIRDLANEHPESIKAQYTLGLMSMNTGQFEKAVERFEKVLALDPNDITAYRLKGRSHLEMGDTTAAAASFDKAMGLADKETRSSIEQELIELKLTK